MRLIIHPLFIVTIAVALLSGYGAFAAAAVVAVLIHESGHAFVANRFGLSTRRLTLLPFGARVNIDCAFLPRHMRIKILLGGSFANICAALAASGLMWLFPQFFTFLGLFVVANTSVALINMLPVYSFDGGKILQTLGGKKTGRVLLVTSNLAFGALLFYAVLVNFNFLLVILTACILFSINTEIRTSDFTSRLYKLRPPNTRTAVREIAITSSATIFQAYKLVSPRHFSKFIVTDRANRAFYENELENWLSIHVLDTRVSDIIT